jgi:hypothetical protein
MRPAGPPPTTIALGARDVDRTDFTDGLSLKGERLSAGPLARNQANRPNRVATDMTISERRGIGSGGGGPPVFTPPSAIGVGGCSAVASIEAPSTGPLFCNFAEHSE